ncbi:hypothetical protein PG991_005533 [Apiospora marii]|uniref:Extracellular membrane protein CFEM domain-containing protein n=1 Tax=Apiospora marii TaxID=335849 RepID=A0ABR1S9F6_9PEZI
MRSFSAAVAACLLFLVSSVFATNTSKSLTPADLQEITKALSPCGLNTTCLCGNDDLNAQISICITKSCSTYDQLKSKNASTTMCHEPIRDESLNQALIAIVGCGVTLVIFLARLIFQLFHNGRNLGGDDYCIIAAMALTLSISCISPFALNPKANSIEADLNGVGRDIWTLTPENIESAFYYFFVAEPIYFVAQGLVKISILLFMVRIFPKRDMRILIFSVCGIIVAYTIAFFFATLFQCQPISFFWRQLDSTFPGKCNDIHLQAWIAAGINIVLDIVVIVLPIKSLWNLQASLPKKITAICMFSLGAAKAGSWSLIELYVAIICTCLPVVRIMIMALGARLFGWNNSMTTRYGGSSGYGTTSKLAKSHRSVKSASTTTMLNNGGGTNGDFIRLNEIEAGNKSGTQLPGDGESEKTLVGNQIHVTRQVVVNSYEPRKG